MVGTGVNGRLNSMQTPTRTQKTIGWILFGLIVAFLAFDAAIHLFPPDQVVKLSADMHVSRVMLTQVGAIMVVCLGLYVVPRTAVLGAVALTGYLGGAVASQLMQVPQGSWLFAVILGVLVWVSLWLRDPRVRSLV